MDDDEGIDPMMLEAARVMVAKLPYTELAKMVVETYTQDDLEAFVTQIDLLTIDDEEEVDF